MAFCFVFLQFTVIYRMPLKRTSYTDGEGRLKAVLLPEEEPDENANIGIPLGPPSLAELELPLAIEVRLNNELFHRGILTASDAIKRRPDVSAAIQSAIKVDTERIVTLYAGKDYRNGQKESSKEQPDKALLHRRPRKPV